MCLQAGLSQAPSELGSPILQQCGLPKEKETGVGDSPLQPSQVPSWLAIRQIVANARNQAHSLGDAKAEAYTLGYLGGVSQQMGKLSEAQQLTEQALQQVSAFDAADIAYRWQWQLARLRHRQGDLKGAISAYTTAFETLKSLRGDLVVMNPEVQLTFRDSVEPVYRELVGLLLQPENLSQANLKKARDTIEALQLAELDDFFREACVAAEPEQIDQIIDQASPRAAVLYAIILENPNRLEVIVKLPQQERLEHYTAELSKQTVTTDLPQLQAYLSDVTRTGEVRALSQQVYRWLIQPAEAMLADNEIKTLVFVLDGPLRNIPMAVLYDGQQYLIEKYAIALTSGLQLLSPKPLAQVSLNALPGGVSESRKLEGREFIELENVKSELQAIQAAVPSTEQILNQDFIEDNLRDQLSRGRFTVVHLATHGQFSSDPEETFILLSDKLLGVKGLERLLRTTDPTQTIPIELLVLSACQTATGDDRAVLGLAGVAVKAGARSTLATLWAVDDQLTAEFMGQFYQELKQPDVTKAEALRKAQLSLLNKEARPYFWAPYTLVGNWL